MNHEDTKSTKKRRDGNERHTGSLIQQDQGETLGWCFLPDDGRLRMLSPDGTRRLVQTGTIIVANDPLEMRHFRIHSAERAIDALQFGRGLFLCRVRLRGMILRERQSAQSSTRYERVHMLVYGNEMIVLGAKDVTTVIYKFMCDLAEWALLHGHLPEFIRDRRLLDAIHRKRRWLDGEIEASALKSAQAEAETVWREIWQIENSSGGMPVASPYAAIVAWATRPTTMTTTNLQKKAAIELRRVRQMLTNVVTPESDLNAELEQRLTEAFGEMESV
ncbi:MAG: hypothetical protein ACR2JW_10545 [Thermomicrobiales bacterium]